MKPRERRRVRLRVRHAMRATYEHVDAATERAAADVSCRKGCAACCRQLTGATLIEAAHIADTYPEEVRARLPVIREHVAALDRHGDTLGISNMDPGDPRARQPLADAWWAEKRRCAFLQGDDTCSIYEARPLACRLWLVRSDPALCGAADPTEVLFLHFEGSERLAMRLVMQSADFCGRGGRGEYGLFPHVMLRAWELAHVQ